MGYHFTYDANGRMTNVTDTSGKAISYSYDALGHRTAMTSPEGNTTTYRYDSAGRLAAIVDNGTFAFGYDTLGRRTSLTLPNGDVTRYGYDTSHRLTSLNHSNKAGAVIASNIYTLDKTGNRLSNTSQERSSSYSYDPLYRLTQAITNTPGSSSNTKSTKGTTTAVTQQKEYFTYDPVGNRLTSDNNKSYAYGPANQLLTNNATSYSYDTNGNLIMKTTSEGTTTYAWDFENRLTMVTMPSGTIAAYRYDPFGRRIEKRVTENGVTTTTRYLYDNEDILAEYDDTNTISNRYTHGPGIDEPLALTTGKESSYYHTDGLGSIVAMTDASGKVVQNYEYDSFGNLKDLKNKIKQPYSYTGKEYDRETGLYYYRARYYDAQVGRFISKDPISFAGGDVNLYGYVGSGAVNWIDPTGNCRKKGESKLACAERIAQEVLGEKLEFVDSLGYWGIGAWAVTAEVGNCTLTSFVDTLASDAIKSSRTAGARESGDIIMKMAAAEKASKIATRTAALKSGLAVTSKAAGVTGLAASGASALARILGYYFGDCSEECSSCD